MTWATDLLLIVGGPRSFWLSVKAAVHGSVHSSYYWPYVVRVVCMFAIAVRMMGENKLLADEPAGTESLD